MLRPEKVTKKKSHDIRDVTLRRECWGEMKGKIDRVGSDTCIFQADAVDVDYLTSPDYHKKSGKLRGSVMLAGPMLARFKKAYLPKPGGDKIGRRRLDTHIMGFETLGAAFQYNPEGFFYLAAPE